MTENLHPRFITRKEFFGCLIYDREIGEYIPFDKDATEIFEYSKGQSINTLYEQFSEKFSQKSFNTFLMLCENIELLDNNKCFLGIFKNTEAETSHLYSPLRVHLQVTKECPLTCVHCFSDSGKPLDKELTTKEIINLINEMSGIGTCELSIGGGEPFCRSDLLEIIKYANKMGINTSLSTNAVLINKKISQKLNELKLKRLNVSFDGVSQKTYEFLRGKNTYKKALRGIKFLKEYSSLPSYIHVTLVKQNISELPGLIRLAENLNFEGIQFDYALPIGRASDSNLTLSYEEAWNVRNMAQKLQRYTGLKMVIPSLPFKTQHRGVYQHFGCIGGSQVCYINSQGFIYPCGFFSHQPSKESLREYSLKELWDNAPIIKLFREFKGNPTCLGCDQYNSCRGGCRARALYNYKNLNAPDLYCPYQSKMTR
ncbi:MAG TPA: radical SAM protein [Candidatus Eremiobacteraeota bacterium]|nr:MAG: Cyclic pyranopterin monophosphate synthase 1 [bacterium ADurb.Bin363]HPZ09167.1 radical SAM protein [Candidatus Eremiobacteraeota bacterium]